MEDKYEAPITGHIIVECLDNNNNVIDRYENHNLIMDHARASVTKLISGVSGSATINKFVLGTEGHITGNYLMPKTSVNGFISSRTKLFSEESLGYTYPVMFVNPGTANGNCAIASEPNSGTIITLTTTTNTVQYTIEIKDTSANNAGVVVFSEAALYSGTNIFSMKCFPGKIKDNTVSLKIIWKILL